MTERQWIIRILWIFQRKESLFHWGIPAHDTSSGSDELLPNPGQDSSLPWHPSHCECPLQIFCQTDIYFFFKIYPVSVGKQSAWKVPLSKDLCSAARALPCATGIAGSACQSASTAEQCTWHRPWCPAPPGMEKWDMHRVTHSLNELRVGLGADTESRSILLPKM